MLNAVSCLKFCVEDLPIRLLVFFYVDEILLHTTQNVASQPHSVGRAAYMADLLVQLGGQECHTNTEGFKKAFQALKGVHSAESIQQIICSLSLFMCVRFGIILKCFSKQDVLQRPRYKQEQIHLI